MKPENSDDLMEENLDHENSIIVPVILDEELCTSMLVILVRMWQTNIVHPSFWLGGLYFELTKANVPMYDTNYGHTIVVYKSLGLYTLSSPDHDIFYQRVMVRY